MNLIAITLNGGVMPATRSALELAGKLAGKLAESGSFVNSAALANPRMAFLGDVFAIPAPLPLANVFSAGDVCIVIGAALALFQITESRFALQLRERRMGSIDPL